MRLDVFLTENNYFNSRNKASRAIEKGEVLVNGVVETKSSKEINPDKDKVIVKEEQAPFVSLGGYKLDIAIKQFVPPIKDNIFIDIGASTGGFTDCLLRYDAKKVYCVDVGENLLDKKISGDHRVVVMDNTNARYLKREDFADEVFGIVVDCSFISLEYILQPLKDLFSKKGYILALIKPQFELNERVKLKHGILKDEKLRLKTIRKIYDFIVSLSLVPTDLVCVTTDSKKNLEYIIKIEKNGKIAPFELLIKNLK